jgi:hypothetical protein
MFVRLLTVWLKRLKTAPSSERWTVAVVMAASILAVADLAVSPDASGMAVVAGVAFCGLMSRVLRLLSAKQARALQACFSNCPKL